ncbi:MAG: hypothetical protein KKE96_04190 [Candidatus Altiarchaeota archaeon]|nr:hypothetical protein [Candidatus Altiarchaeota archaeon]
MIDDEIALELVDFWIESYPDNLRGIPEHLKDKVSGDDVRWLQGPYREGSHITPEALRYLKNDILSRLNEKQRHQQYEKWQKKNTFINQILAVGTWVLAIIAIGSLFWTIHTTNQQSSAVNKQLELMSNQTDLMQLEHSAIFRPHLSIETYQKERLNNSFIVTYKIINVGRLPAKVVNIIWGPYSLKDKSKLQNDLIFPGQYLTIPYTLTNINDKTHLFPRVKVGYTYGSYENRTEKFSTWCSFDIDIKNNSIQVKDCEMI